MVRWTGLAWAMWTCTGDLCSSRIHFRYFCRSYTTSHTAQRQCLRSSVWYSRLRDVFCGRAEIVDRDSLLREAGPRQSTAPWAPPEPEVRASLCGGAPLCDTIKTDTCNRLTFWRRLCVCMMSRIIDKRRTRTCVSAASLPFSYRNKFALGFNIACCLA